MSAYRCQLASADVVCMAPADFRVTLHPPKMPGDQTCGDHRQLLCQHCVETIALNVHRWLKAAKRGGPQPVCPVCACEFRELHDVMREVERL